MWDTQSSCRYFMQVSPGHQPRHPCSQSSSSKSLSPILKAILCLNVGTTNSTGQDSDLFNSELRWNICRKSTTHDFSLQIRAFLKNERQCGFLWGQKTVRSQVTKGQTQNDKILILNDEVSLDLKLAFKHILKSNCCEKRKKKKKN